jgi:hypothetical protein
VPDVAKVEADLGWLISRWIEAAERMLRARESGSELTEMGRAALFHQAITMRGCAEELRAALAD